MATIHTSIELADNMSATFNAINNSITTITGSFGVMEGVVSEGFNPFRVEELNQQLVETNTAQQQVNDTLGQLDPSAYERISSSADKVGDEIRENINNQQSFNNELHNGNKAASGLQRQIMGMAAAYVSVQGVEKVLNLSDTMAKNEARLNLIVDDGGSVQELQDKIFLSAQDARADYQMTSDVISKLGMQAGDAFASNDELLFFSEQLSKTFKVAGTDAQGVQSVMYNLTQAMAGGVLRGQDLNSVLNNAQPIVQNIADYLGISVGEIRKMAEEGELTADVVKNSMFAAAEATNERFEAIPLAFGDAAASIKNNALIAFQPVLKRLNQVANSQAFQIMATNVVNALVAISGTAIWIFDMIAGAGEFITNNWSTIEPIIFGVIAALGVYIAYMGVVNAIELISKGIKLAGVIASYAKAAATGAEVSANTAATAAQWGLNTALLACPVTWIIIAIIAFIAVIYLTVAAVNHFAGESISATGVIFGAFAVLGATIWNIVIGVIDGIIQFLWTNFVEPWIGIVEFVLNVFNGGFNSFGDACKNLLGQIISWFLSLGKVVTKIIDAIFGTSWTDGLNSLQSNVLEWGKNENAITLSREAPSLSSLGVGRIDTMDAWNAGYELGEKAENALANFDPASLFDSNLPEQGEYGGFDYDPSLARNVAGINSNTGASKDYAEEDLKYLRDIAERETINRYFSVDIDMSGITNTVNSSVDLDGIGEYLGDMMTERLEMVAEGV